MQHKKFSLAERGLALVEDTRLKVVCADCPWTAGTRDVAKFPHVYREAKAHAEHARHRTDAVLFRRATYAPVSRAPTGAPA